MWKSWLASYLDDSQCLRGHLSFLSSCRLALPSSSPGLNRSGGRDMRVLFLGAGGRTWDRSLTSWRLTSAGFLGIGIREGGVVKGGVVLKAWLFGGNLNAFLRVNGAWENAATCSLGKAK